MSWKSGSPSQLHHSYAFQYDRLNQLTLARYAASTDGTNWGTNENPYIMSNIQYDLNGNITYLIREGLTSPNPETFDPIDNLTYYYNGNQLKAVDDFVTPNHGYDFADNGAWSAGGQNTEYSYDDNGNMISDSNKGIVATYNHLNLPTNVDFSAGGNIEWLYNAAGEKLRKVVYDQNGDLVTTLDYIGSFVLRRRRAEFLQHRRRTGGTREQHIQIRLLSLRPSRQHPCRLFRPGQ